MTARVLVCRPQQEADRTAQILRDMGLSPVVFPILNIEPTHVPCPLEVEEIDALVVTSRQAISYLAHLAEKPAYAVGNATADALSKAGFTRVRATHGNAKALSDAVPGFLVQDDLPSTAQLVWPCAQDPAFDMAAALGRQNVSCERWAAYRADPPARLSKDVEEQLASGAIDVVLLTSPRIAATFAALAPDIPANTRLLCLSEAVRLALPTILHGQAEAAPEPNETALISLL